MGEWSKMSIVLFYISPFPLCQFSNHRYAIPFLIIRPYSSYFIIVYHRVIIQYY